ncbi:MAG: methylated-DNA-protein-cysteine methyltransferase-like protein [Gammaproteobacteria bacterium]|jgi:methylated-DNA-protein-cysteine methyltransferase-like protein
MNSRHLTVYVRRHCHLCEQMVNALEPWRQGYDLRLDLVDVDEDPVLAARFGERVPVLSDGDTIVAEFFLDEGALRRHLQINETASELHAAGVYARIYAIVRQIPAGKVATYGQIAKVEGHATARMVGYAMAALRGDNDVPWQRVINARGEVSERAGGGGTSRQRTWLDAEGVLFNARGRVDFSRAGWDGPSAAWCAVHGFHLLAASTTGATVNDSKVARRSRAPKNTRRVL